MAYSTRSAAGVIGGLLGLVGLSVVAGILVSTAITPAIAMTSAAAGSTIDIFDNLPSVLDIDALILPSTIYAKNAAGKEAPLATYYDQNRIPVTFGQIAPVAYDAILSSEDPRFYQDGGIDLTGTMRALVSNLHGGAPVQGGSSIDQQYVKNVLMQHCEWNAHTNAQFDDCWRQATASNGVAGYQRKLQELRYAVALDQHYSKSSILLGYLNIVNFGGTTYGIQAAAEHYFGIPASALDLAQAATLAGIVQSPNIYRIDLPRGTTTDAAGKAVNGAADHYSLTKQRQEYVLGQMLRYGKITHDQYEAAVKAPIVPKITSMHTGCATSEAPYFCAYVTATILSDPVFGPTATARADLLHRGGLKIYTTLDPRVQTAAQSAVNRYAPASIAGMSFGATSVSVQASTGRVLSMAQNTQYIAGGKAGPGQTGIVYAGDLSRGGSTGFQPGSSFKLFTLLAWLESGRSVYQTVDGHQRVYTQWQDSCLSGGHLNAFTKVGNYRNEAGYTGTPMQFTAQSLNSGYLAMANQLDLCTIGKMAARLGVTLANGRPVPLSGSKDPAPYEVLGSDAISPLAMASAYATVADKGVHCRPLVIDKAVGPQGQVLPIPQRSCMQVIPPNIAATAIYALTGVLQPGGTAGVANPNDGTPLFAKTGTAGSVQTWLITSDSQVTTANWIGNASGTADLMNTFTPAGLELDQIRFPLARDIQTAIDQLYPGAPFPAPDPALTIGRYIPPAMPTPHATKGAKGGQGGLPGTGFGTPSAPAPKGHKPH